MIGESMSELLLILRLAETLLTVAGMTPEQHAELLAVRDAAEARRKELEDEWEALAPWTGGPK
jgi:cell division protein FtsL